MSSWNQKGLSGQENSDYEFALHLFLFFSPFSFFIKSSRTNHPHSTLMILCNVITSTKSHSTIHTWIKFLLSLPHNWDEHRNLWGTHSSYVPTIAEVTHTINPGQERSSQDHCRKVVWLGTRQESFRVTNKAKHRIESAQSMKDIEVWDQQTKLYILKIYINWHDTICQKE